MMMTNDDDDDGNGNSDGNNDDDKDNDDDDNYDEDSNWDDNDVDGNYIDDKNEDEGDDDNQVSLSQISAAALVIRNALTQGLLGVTDSISCARKGQRPTSISTGSCFSTTSWSFPIWDIDFGATLVGFHGHPSYPIPDFNMFSSVIVPGSQHGDLVYQLLIPCVKVKEAEAMHQRLCTLFLEWHAMEAANFGSPL